MGELRPPHFLKVNDQNIFFIANVLVDIGFKSAGYASKNVFLQQNKQICQHTSVFCRLLKYSPDSGKVEVVLDGLYFANGVQLSKDESFLLVVETSRCRIQK